MCAVHLRADEVETAEGKRRFCQRCHRLQARGVRA
jgi:hypothetical protein